MSSFSPQSPTQNPTNTQVPFQQSYNQQNSNQAFDNPRSPPQTVNGYPPQQYQQYPSQYQPQNSYQPYQQHGYPLQNQYQNVAQANLQYGADINQQYGQNQPPNAGQLNAGYVPAPMIPQNSPLLRHQLSGIVSMIKKNLQEFSPQFQQKFTDNQNFKSLNRKLVLIPSFLIMSHVFLNWKKKWFRLTVNASLIRHSLVGLLLLYFSTNVLYVAASKDIIARNRERIEKIVVRQEFIGGGNERVV